MNVFTVEFGEKILLVGEGNFSFSVGFMNLNNNVINNSNFCSHSSVEIVTSCFESNTDMFCNKKSNIDLLQQKGFTVLQNIDATRLKEYPEIGCKKFTKIIFNFPHVGGKMKIHLNRKLLADFFSSAKDVLDKDGLILVTLCDGQGGTGADRNQRRWDDSWKVVEMAALSDFALKSVFPFVFQFFPDYVSIGYRSLQKGFNTNDALVHVFKLTAPPLLIFLRDNEIQSLLELQKIDTPLGGLKVSNVHALNISQDPFKSTNSLQKHLYDSLINNLPDEEVHFIEDVFIYGVSCQYCSPDEFVIKHFLNTRDFNGRLVVCKGLLLKELTKNFGSQPVSCEVLCFGEGSSLLVKKVILKIAKDFKFSELNMLCISTDGCFNKLYIDDLKKTELCRTKMLALGDRCVEMCTIYLDNIAKLFFGLDCWQQLWAAGNRIEYCDKISLYTPCLFPPRFTFDLSFSIQDSYYEGIFLNLLWQLAGNIVLNVELISTYEPPGKNVKNFCYRLEYKSYELPLHRNRVIDIQRNVIGKALERVLNGVIL